MVKCLVSFAQRSQAVDICAPFFVCIRQICIYFCSRQLGIYVICRIDSVPVPCSTAARVGAEEGAEEGVEEGVDFVIRTRSHFSIIGSSCSES